MGATGAAVLGFVVGDVLGSIYAVGPDRALSEFTALGLSSGVVGAIVSVLLWRFFGRTVS